MNDVSHLAFCAVVVSWVPGFLRGSVRAAAKRTPNSSNQHSAVGTQQRQQSLRPLCSLWLCGVVGRRAVPISVISVISGSAWPYAVLRNEPKFAQGLVGQGLSFELEVQYAAWNANTTQSDMSDTSDMVRCRFPVLSACL